MATYLSDLNLVKSSTHWFYNVDHDALFKKYAHRFPTSYIGCTVRATMMLVNEDSIGYHYRSATKTPSVMKKVTTLIEKNLQDIILYLIPDEWIKRSDLLEYSIDKDVLTVALRLTFREPVNDLTVRVDVDRNFDHWRYNITQRETTTTLKCIVM